MSALALSLTGLKDSTIRGAVSSDGVHVFSTIDFISKVCQFKDAGTSARREFKRLTDDGSEFQAEIMSLCRHHKFPGIGQRSTPVMTVRGLQRLLAILDSKPESKVASDYRAIVESTFTRVLSGDMSLVKVVDPHVVAEAGAESGSEALVHQPAAVGSVSSALVAEDPLDSFSRKRRLERTEFEFAVEMEERWSRLRDQALSRTERMVDMLMKLRPNEKLDERTVSLIEDQAKSIVMNVPPTSVPAAGVPAVMAPVMAPGMAPGIAPGIVPGIVPVIAPASPEMQGQLNENISVSLVANLLGFKCTLGQLKEIGKRMAVRYREAYQRDPPKHRQQVGGGVVAVNSYVERDRGMMEAVIKEYMG